MYLPFLAHGSQVQEFHIHLCFILLDLGVYNSGYPGFPTVFISFFCSAFVPTSPWTTETGALSSALVQTPAYLIQLQKFHSPCL